MATFVLIHGGSVTGEVWNQIIPILQDNGHTIYNPTLLDEHSNNLTSHINQICLLIQQNNLYNVILVGHSYGGMVITGVGCVLPNRINQLIYVDAALPKPGQSLFDIIYESGKIPLSYYGVQELPPYIEKLEFEPNKIKHVACSYILCTKSEFYDITYLVRDRIKSYKNWYYFELETTHVPMNTMPQELAQILIEKCYL